MVLGFADLHAHQYTNLGFGGLAFWGAPFVEGMYARPVEDQLPYAMPWCDHVHGAGGTGDWVDHFMMGRAGHLVGGNPEFDGWPRWDNLTHQGMFESCLKRAVDGGLRLMVTHAVNNEMMAKIVHRRFPVDDGPAVARQLDCAWRFQEHVDNRYGGLGKGWYRLVFSPAEARRVIADGKLAVVLGIEVDYPFDSYLGAREPTWAHVEQQLDIAYKAGVRHVFPIHFGNNAFGGTAFQNDLEVALPPTDRNDPLYLIANTTAINPLNPITVGAADTAMHAYRVDTEPAPEYSYRTGRRNKLGLTALGHQLVEALVKRGVMVDIDHMSAKAKADTFDICEHLGQYPVVSSHTGLIDMAKGEKKHEGQLTAQEVDRLRRLGGVLAVITHQGDVDQIETYTARGRKTIPHTCGQSSQTLLQVYRKAVDLMGGRPVAVGTDYNGFIIPTGPRFGPEACPGTPKPDPIAAAVAAATGNQPPALPRLSYAGGGFVARATDQRVRLGKSRLGNKVYDFNTDGLAHYGMLPDLIADLEAQGLPLRELDPLLHSAEAYVDAWEKAWNNPAHLPADQLPSPTRPPPSYGVVRPGAFCRAGTTGRSKHGVPMFCEQILPYNIGRWKHIP